MKKLYLGMMLIQCCAYGMEQEIVSSFQELLHSSTNDLSTEEEQYFSTKSAYNAQLCALELYSTDALIETLKGSKQYEEPSTLEQNGHQLQLALSAHECLNRFQVFKACTTAYPSLRTTNLEHITAPLYQHIQEHMSQLQAEKPEQALSALHSMKDALIQSQSSLSDLHHDLFMKAVATGTESIKTHGKKYRRIRRRKRVKKQ